MKVRFIFLRAMLLFLLFTVIIGPFYTGAVTGLSNTLFPSQAKGSIMTVNGNDYGSALLGQDFKAPNHMWGRMTNLDVKTFHDEHGKPLMYAGPSNLSPTSEAFAERVEKRIADLKALDPEQADQPIPVDLVTVSASGLDPHISPAAADYQVPRLARENHLSEADVRQIIDACSEGRFLGIFGEKTVNVLKVNLMLEGRL